MSSRRQVEHAPPALCARPAAPPEALPELLQLFLELELPRQRPPALWWHSCDLARSPEAAMAQHYIATVLAQPWEEPPPPLRLAELVAFYRAGRWYFRGPSMPQPERRE